MRTHLAGERVTSGPVRKFRPEIERGSVLPAVALALALLLVVVMVLGGLAQRAMWRSRAQAAADAAALAGVVGGRGEAARLAVANGAVLVRFDEQGSNVEVTVSYGGTHAIARAEQRVEVTGRGCQPLACSGP